MRFLFLIVSDPEGEPTRDDESEVDRWVDTMDASGARILGERLRPAADATTVRRRGDELIVTSGSISDTEGWIAGFDVIEAAGIDEAVDIASQHEMARNGRIEIRPFWPFDD